MSLWTPDGERPIRRQPEPQGDPAASRPGPEAPGPVPGPPGTGDDPTAPQLTPEQQAEAEAMAAEMNEVRQQMAAAPAAVVVANHAMGLYELAAIHLSQQPPKLSEAKVAVDAFAALLESLAGRLGPDETTLADALAQIRLAYVQLQGQEAGSGAAPTE